MKYTEKKFKNGLTLITVPMKGNPTVSVFVAAKTGSKYETKRVNGISHFLEHMCFKGTTKRPSSKLVNSELDAVGAINNAFTSHEYTAYYAKADYKNLDTVFDVVTDIYLDPQFPKEELEKERGVILQEYHMYQDNPRWTVNDMWMEMLHGDTPAGWRILGEPKQIKSVTRKDFVDYHKSQYGADNTVVVVSGNIDEKDITKRVQKTFKNISSKKSKGKKAVKENQKAPQIKLQHKDLDQTHIILGVRSFGVSDKRNRVLKVLNAVLSGGMSSRLFSKMREELGICYYVRADRDGYTDHGTYAVAAGVDQKRLDVAVKAIIEELKKLKTDLVDEKELKKAKKGMTGRMNLGLESSDSMAQFVLGSAALDLEIRTPKEIEKEINSVTSEEIMELANELFVDSQLNLAILGKHKGTSELKKLLTFK
jgi:predicted Zn-dependent peptidase